MRTTQLLRIKHFRTIDVKSFENHICNIFDNTNIDDEF